MYIVANSKPNAKQPLLFPSRGGLCAWPSPRKRFLGAASSPADALSQNSQSAWSKYCSGAAGSGSCGGGSTYGAFVWQAITSRTLPSPTQQNASTDCAGVQTGSGLLTGSKIAGAAGGATTAAASVAGISSSFAASGALAAIPIAGIFASIGAMITGLFAAHHAQAVQAQATAICSAVPSAQQILQQVDAQLAAGALTPSQATQLYQQLQTQFSAAMKNGTSYKKGDALWGFDTAMQAVIYARTLDLQSGILSSGSPLPSAQTAQSSGGSATSGATTSSAASSLPSWTPWAVLGLGAAALLWAL